MYSVAANEYRSLNASTPLGVLKLLRSHEVGRAQRTQGLGEIEIAFEVLDQAQVGQLGLAGGGQQDVVRFDVAMDEPALVDPVQGLTHLDDQADRFGLGKPPYPVQAFAQALALDVFHDQEGGGASQAEVEHANDVGVDELAGDLTFLGKAQSQYRIGSHFASNHLDRHDLASLRVEAFVDRAHAPVADFAQNLVVADFCPHHRRSDSAHDKPSDIGSNRAAACPVACD
jgi:hypothetical protein